MSSRASRPLAATAILAMVAACTGSDEEPVAEFTSTPPAVPATTTPTPPSGEPTVDELWRVHLGVVSGPRIAGDTVLVHAIDDEELFLVGIDAETSEERWRAPASPGEVVTGIAVVPRVIDDHPVYFRPHSRGNLYAELVVADPVTGDDLVTTDALLFRSAPSACPDDDRSICVRVRDDYDDTATAQRMAVDGDGSLVADDGVADAAGSTRPIGSHGLVDLRVDDVEYVAAYDGGEELWRHRVDELFGSGYSSDYSWSWDYDAATDLFIGSLGFEPESDDEHQVLDLSRGTLVAIERTTGDVRWTERGVYDHCSGAAAVPGDDVIALQSAGESTSGLTDLPVRCRVTGEMVFGTDAEKDPVEIQVEGYDPATGDTLWDVEVGDARVLLGRFAAEDDGPTRYAGRTGIVVDIAGTPTVIDLATGETDDPGETTLWCQGMAVSFDYHEPYYVNGEPRTGRYGEPAVFWCDADGVVADEAPAEVHHAIGRRIGDVAYVVTTDGLVAYR